VRAKDVALVFADAATGAHSPALVSQGRVAAVIAARPAERRAMLEEAAGIAGLHVRRRDAEAKLRATETNLARLDDLLLALDGQVGALRRQARAAERYKALSGRIRMAEARLIFARWRDAASAAEAARVSANRAEDAVTDAQAAARAAAKKSSMPRLPHWPPRAMPCLNGGRMWRRKASRSPRWRRGPKPLSSGSPTSTGRSAALITNAAMPTA